MEDPVIYTTRRTERSEHANELQLEVLSFELENGIVNH